MEKIRKKIGIVCCSNGLKPSYTKKLDVLEQELEDIGLELVFSSCIYEENDIFSVSAKRRADALMQLYKSDEIADIFDISGGDLANGILPYLDYDLIGKSDKCFWGYSDLTTVLNAIYAKTGKVSGLYQFVQGQSMEGIVIGGNIRCFLKLAGTSYMPDFEGKILLLESRSGSVPQMETYLSQLQQLGAFDKISGILLGTFTQLEKERERYLEEYVDEGRSQGFDGICETISLKENAYPSMADLIRGYVKEDLPIATTSQIGHGQDAKAIQIGGFYRMANADSVVTF